MKENELATHIKQVLNQKSKLSVEAEHVLLTQVEDLLAKRRDQVVSREDIVREANQLRTRRRIAVRNRMSRLFEFLAIHPDTPAMATTFIALVLTFVALQNRQGPTFRISYSDMPDLPKNNDFSSRYDAQLLAERQAYEREVEDAHKKTSGGI